MSGSILIRPICKKDNSAIAQIIREVFDEYHLPKTGTVYNDPATDHLFELFQHPKAACFVAEYDNKLVGSAGIYPTKGLPNGYCEFSKFYISKNGRGRGIGKLLINTCINSAIKFGYKKLYIESFDNLDIALNMYKKMGFKNLSKPLGLSGHTACTVWQEYSLDSEKL